MFNDASAEIGKSYYYRVIALNSAGISKPSNAVGPVSVSCKTLVDEMQDMQFIHKHSGNLSRQVKQASNFKEDAHRLKGTSGDYLIYEVEAPINSWKVYSFFPEQITDFKFSVSVDGRDFKQVKLNRKDYFVGKGEYDYYKPVLYEGTNSGK